MIPNKRYGGLYWALVKALALASICVLVACGEPPGAPLVRLQIPVTQGAAAGYVPDSACARCHSDLYQSYQEVGMAKSFTRPRADRMIENFEAPPYYHQASDRYYRMTRDGDEITFERYQLDSQGEPIHRLEMKVDWVLGSGHTSRSYLHQNLQGELFVLPLAWYTQSQSWRMSPGFDRPNHVGVERQVRRECMFCHNAYPEVAAGSDAYGAPQEFPQDLPEGIGCQRCHGPGADHLRAALDNDRAKVRSTIVQPGSLSPQREADICYSCHFQPSVALTGVRTFGRSVYSFRPGEALKDYMTLIDVVQKDAPKEERFEINHHPYRLEQSTCFLESEPGELTCTHCHDPHKKVPQKQRKAHYRDACLSCHKMDSCTLEDMATAANLAGAGASPIERDATERDATERDATERDATERDATERDATERDATERDAIETDDCASCHMPRRRTQDVVEVVMTDHRIQRQHGGPALVAALEETIPILVGVDLIRPLEEPSPVLEQVYLASAVMQAGGNQDAIEFLAKTLPLKDLTSPEPQLDLAKGLLGIRRFAEAEATLNTVLETWPETVRAYDWRAVARLQQGNPEGALEDLATSIRVGGERPDPLFNQGIALFGLNRMEEAVDSLRQATELRPTASRIWLYLGLALDRKGDSASAAQALRKALEVNPSNAEASLAWSRLLEKQGNREEALRILERGTRQVNPPAKLLKAYEEMRDKVENRVESGRIET